MLSEHGDALVEVLFAVLRCYGTALVRLESIYWVAIGAHEHEVFSVHVLCVVDVFEAALLPVVPDHFDATEHVEQVMHGVRAGLGHCL